MQRSIGRGHPSTSRGRYRRLRVLVAAAITAGWALGLAGPASAQYVTPEPPQTGSGIDSQTLTEVADTDAAVAGRSSVAGAGAARAATRPGGSGLPVTGGDVVGLAALGAGAIAAGTLLRRHHRGPSKT